MNLSILYPWRSDNGPRQQIFDWVLTRSHKLFPDAEVIVADDNSPDFSRAGSRNEAARQATGEVFLFADADTVFSREQIERGLSLIRRGAPWVLPYGSLEYYNLTREHSRQLLECPPDVQLHKPIEWEHRLESWAGAVMVPRQAFEQICGYDERFNGWGGEDNALRFALDIVVGGHTRLAFENIQHVWHPRGDDFAGNEWPANRMLMRKYQITTSRDEMLALCQQHNSL